MFTLTRRQFIKSGSAMAGAAALSSFARAKVSNEMPGYRALVCITLGGGADSFNMMVPMDALSHRHYVQRRGNLALNRDELLLLDHGHQEGRSFALHHGLRELHEIYSAGNIALVANVGSLPSFEVKPEGIYRPDLSHSDLLVSWQRGAANNACLTGWAGRAADVFGSYDWHRRFPTNISMSGRNMMQLGSHSAAANLQLSSCRQRPTSSVGVDFSYITEQLAERAIASGRPREVQRKLRLLDRAESESRMIVDVAVAGVPEFNTRFASDSFSKDLEHVARIIAARKKLGASRQIFYIHFDGWDHHHHLLDSQAEMLPILSRGLAAFRAALIEHDAFDDVTTFTTSEFGRSLESNGSGSDHGWGGHHIVMGGGLNGGGIYGQYPDLANGSPLDIGGGCFVPTTSMDEYLAEMVLWLGVPVSKLSYVLPDVSRFWSGGSRVTPMGIFT
jgi:uncharacterized protein (DUF1501 family)